MRSHACEDLRTGNAWGLCRVSQMRMTKAKWPERSSISDASLTVQKRSTPMRSDPLSQASRHPAQRHSRWTEEAASLLKGKTATWNDPRATSARPSLPGPDARGSPQPRNRLSAYLCRISRTSYLKQLDLLVLAEQELGGLTPVRRMLPAMLDEAGRMAVYLASYVSGSVESQRAQELFGLPKYGRACPDMYLHTGLRTSMPRQR